MIKFSDLNLNPKVLKAIAEAGYENPTPIQAGAIPPALDGRDVLGICDADDHRPCAGSRTGADAPFAGAMPHP